jgi:hypothetical protein
LLASTRIALKLVLFDTNSRPSMYGSKNAAVPETWISPSDATVIVPPIGLPLILIPQVA